MIATIPSPKPAALLAEEDPPAPTDPGTALPARMVRIVRMTAKLPTARIEITATWVPRDAKMLMKAAAIVAVVTTMARRRWVRSAVFFLGDIQLSSSGDGR